MNPTRATRDRKTSTTQRARTPGALRMNAGVKARGGRDDLIAPLLRWFAGAQRDLPWRAVDPATGLRNPYFSLVSEVMLQQTQVARVVEKFGAFLDKFPTPEALASADEDGVLAAWTGLGYYRRARLLHAAARAIVARFGGKVPEEVSALRSLPGVGAYTAGAIASVVFGKPEAIVDTNVSRVLLRVYGKRLRASDPRAVAWCWEAAGRLVQAAHASHRAAGEWNEALMELGATVCPSRNPACGRCPIAASCVARRLGIQGSIPLPKRPARRSAVVHSCVVFRLRDGRVLVEQRGGTGLWAGLWQAPTIESVSAVPWPTARAVAHALGLHRSCRLVLREEFLFKTTHRDVLFRVFACENATVKISRGRVIARGARLVDRGVLAGLGMSSPQRRVLLQLPMSPKVLTAAGSPAR